MMEAATAAAEETELRRLATGSGSDEREDEPLMMAAEGSGADTPPAHARPQLRRHARVRWYQYVAISSYWFGWAFLWLPLFIVIIPLQVFELVGDEDKGTSLGATLLLGSATSLLFAPMFGLMSDRCTHKKGRRRPFIVVGTVLATIALLIMARSPDLQWFSMGFLLLSIANNMIVAPCSALLPDVIPPDSRGVASGWIGGFSMLGSLAGGYLSYRVDDTGIPGAYLVLAFVNVLCTAFTVRFIEETPLTDPLPVLSCCERLCSFFSPFRNHDFRVVFFTRFLMQMGILTVQEYLQWYLKDAIGPSFVLNGEVVATTPQKAVAILFIPVLFGALLSSLLAGVLSDRFGGRRKIIVYVSAILMSVASVFFSITRSFTFDMVLGLLFGLGYGGFSVIDWAMATDVLPSEADFAKDMGIWSLALVLPQVIAAPVAGHLLDYFEHVGSKEFHWGYSMVFLLACGYYLLGAYYVKFLEKVK